MENEAVPKVPGARAWLTGLLAGVAYGLGVRLFFGLDSEDSGFWVMTFSFVFLVPFGIGILSVRPFARPTWVRRLVWPWAPATLSVAIAWMTGAEGAICVVIGLPVILVMASLGGLIGGFGLSRSTTGATAVLLLPLAGIPIEGLLLPPTARDRDVRSVIDVRATPERVWQEIESVRTIERHERRPALYTAIGFPPPLSATLTGEGVGAVRHARFGGGVLFIETITEWETNHVLAFAIDAQTDSIPPATLDPHVTIGGPFFDVLSGRYEIEPSAGGVRLVLTSRHRLATRYNFYSGIWTDAIMSSIQRNILRVVKARAETTT